MKLKYILGSTLCAVFINMSSYAGGVIKFPSEAAVCAGCHGQNGVGLASAYPNLAGQKKEYLIKQLNAFKSGARKDPTMNGMARALSSEAIKTIATYYSSLTPSK